jgi:cytoskeletal protein RodZ
MTFLELEKKCRQRKIKKIILYVCAVLIFAGVLFACAVKYFVPTPEKEKIPEVKRRDVKILKPVKSVKKENNAVKEAKPAEKEKKISLILDLNITEPASKNKKDNNSSELRQKPLKSTTLIQTSALPSYQTCIALSKQFFSKGKYEESLKWAKNANIQNKKAEESWIMSAKSLYALGEKKKAVDILKIYLQYHKSVKVQDLLGEFNETD